MEHKKYIIRTVVEILDLEPDVRARFIEDLPLALDFYDLCVDERPEDFYIEWTDDGSKRCVISEEDTRKELFKLEVSEESNG